MSEEKQKPVEFRIIPNGPLHAIGTFKIIDLNGKIVDITDEAFFCRCGNSKTKPFCDGSHRHDK